MSDTHNGEPPRRITEPCGRCGIPHRYGTTDPEHRPHYVGCVNSLLAEVERLRSALAEANKRADEAALRSIEARNPGIDIEQVRATHFGGGEG